MQKTQLPNVTPGAAVVTADGATLGTVADVGDVSFKVDVRLARDYWLGRDYVVAASDGVVSMSFARSDLKAYKLPDPSKTSIKEAAEESLVDAVLPEDEQLAQRRRMEEELARQRGASSSGFDGHSGTAG